MNKQHASVIEEAVYDQAQPFSRLSPSIIIAPFVILGSLMVLLMLSACQPMPLQSPLASPTAGEEILSFETLELREPTKPNYWENQDPGLLIIANSEDISTTSEYITDDAIARLKQVDFRESFALIAFDGLKTEVQHDFQIQRIVRRQDKVLIIARPSRKSGPIAQGAISSLYHLVKIKKEDKWAQLIVFELYFQNNQPAVATISRYIP